MTASPPSPAPAPDDPAPLSRGGRSYAKARRHSVLVRWLKFGIPAGAAAALAAVVLNAYVNPLSQIPGLTLGTVSLSGTKVAMENPRLTGFRKDARPYEVTAKAAFQDIRKPTLIELKDLKGRLNLDGSGATAELSSAGGLFDTTKELLEFGQEIRVTTSRGEDATLRSATVDFKAGTVVSRDPVRISTPNGVVEAEGLHVSDNGATLSFTGRVRTQFTRVPVLPADVPEPRAGSRSESGARMSQVSRE